jgi:hypothetical protein
LQAARTHEQARAPKKGRLAAALPPGPRTSARQKRPAFQGPTRRGPRRTQRSQAPSSTRSGARIRRKANRPDCCRFQSNRELLLPLLTYSSPVPRLQVCLNRRLPFFRPSLAGANPIVNRACASLGFRSGKKGRPSAPMASLRRSRPDGARATGDGRQEERGRPPA